MRPIFISYLMVIFRCTRKLAKRFNLELDKNIAEGSTTALGDWYFNYFSFQRTYYLLGVSEKSLLPVIIPAKEIKNFPERFCRQLRDVLSLIGVEQTEITSEVIEMSAVSFERTKSRMVLGCQNDYIRLILHILHNDPPQTLLEHSRKLGRTPFSSLGYANAEEAALSCFQKTAG